MEIENYKTQHITGYINIASPYFDMQLNCEFPVDEIVLKYVTYHNLNTDGNDFFLLKTDLVQSDVFFVFPQSNLFFESMNTPFKPNNSNIQGTYRFRITDTDGDPPGITVIYFSCGYVHIV